MQEATLVPGTIPAAEARLRQRFLKETALVPGGDRIARCLQCGTCTGSCPVSYAMDISPRQVIALFRAGEMEKILRSRTIWICASCYMCATRCPQSIKITDLLYSLKRTAMEAGLFPQRFPVYRLSHEFVANVKRYGRNHELSLLTNYYLKSNPWELVRLVPLGLAMWRRGRAVLLPRKIKGIQAIRSILQAAAGLRLPVEKAQAEYSDEAVGYRAIG